MRGDKKMETTSNQVAKQIEGFLASHPEMAPSLNRFIQRIAEGDELAISALADITQNQETDPAKLSYEQWRESYRAFVNHPRAGNPNMDDSRESFYAEP